MGHRAGRHAAAFVVVQRSLVAVAIVILLVGAGIFAAQSAGWLAPRTASGVADTETIGLYGRVPAFSLVERSGRRVTADDLRGRVWVASFIYTSCTDTCPLETRQLATVQDAFAAASDLRLVSISVDPDHDTPEILRRYADRYRAGDRWLFLTGDRRAIYCLASEGFRLGLLDADGNPVTCGTAWHSTFGLGPPAAWAHGGETSIAHSTRVALVDRQGRIRAYHAATEPDSIARLKENVRRLLDER